MTLALTKTDFGPCKQDPSSTVFTSRTRDVERGKGAAVLWGEEAGMKDDAEESGRQVNKTSSFSFRLFSWTP